jgi:hypothetical protein
MRRPLLLLAAAVLACAASGPVQRRPVHGPYAASGQAATWERALEVLRAEGYEIGMADGERFIVVTRERELQSPCGEAQCLAREAVFLRLTEGQAVLAIHRENWDQATRRWEDAVDARGVASVEAAEQALLRAITGGAAELRLARKGEGCGSDAECEKGLACAQRRCASR